jgi:preprotein translocase subunit SecD
LGLYVFIVVTIALYKIIPVTLTLPGIAGFILSIGMALDGNILIF